MEYSVTGEMEGDCTSCIRLCNRAQIVKLVNYLCKYKLGIAIYIFWRKPRNRVLYYEVHAMAEYVWVMSDDAMAYRYMQTYPAVHIQTLCDASFHSALYLPLHVVRRCKIRCAWTGRAMSLNMWQRTSIDELTTEIWPGTWSAFVHVWTI
ncbi:hypothetical protein ASPSYDRAFT_1048220 [Aspergillus sydowii CBS 593.65]|uniref:Uncharacterized protein n=1 Tax=Aspergillus sydowii CBS 593.65 TaxID=1036612 RepID=A0A1L9TFX1_9EURO|nr:uncharacterized protein ASPSYDRAFT_1048220 [Aspergillus sydowii CBS 593.65]OJJ58337.1 hypothetical protein ASPSYDRAFT_1048220 [Aspergillus sydowii CBS 593.65]